jgi:hypothetical protein
VNDVLPLASPVINQAIYRVSPHPSDSYHLPNNNNNEQHPRTKPRQAHRQHFWRVQTRCWCFGRCRSTPPSRRPGTNLGKLIGNATQPHPTTGEHGTGAGVSGGVSQPPHARLLIISTLTPTLPTLNLAVNTTSLVSLVSTPVSVVTTPRLVSSGTALTLLPTSSWVSLASRTLSAVPTEVDSLVMPLQVKVCLLSTIYNLS